MILKVVSGLLNLIYGSIYVQDNAVATVIGTAGKGNKVQITIFGVDGLSNGATPDHTNDHIIVDKVGVYLALVFMSASTAAGGSDSYGFSLYKNNGATEFANVHSHRLFQGGGGDRASVVMGGLISGAVTDTIEVWTWNEDNTENIVIDDITLILLRLSG